MSRAIKHVYKPVESHPNYIGQPHILLAAVVTGVLIIGFLGYAMAQLLSWKPDFSRIQTAKTAQVQAPAPVQPEIQPTVVPTPTHYEDALLLPTSGYTATVYTGHYLYSEPNDGASRVRTPGELVVEIVGFDYTSSGWSLVELDNATRVWVHSWSMDLPDGSVVLRQLPELVP